MHLTVPLGDVGHVESRIRNHVDAHFVYLEIVLILAQGRCMVCVERTTGPEIILDAPDETPRSQG
jgi:hypothetical protein